MGRPLEQGQGDIFTANGQPMDLRGQATLTLRLGNRTVEAHFKVAEMGTQAILGAVFLWEQGLIVDVMEERLWWSEVREDRCRVVCT